eukprot:scpid93106/ scgid6893/ 
MYNCIYMYMNMTLYPVVDDYDVCVSSNKTSNDMQLTLIDRAHSICSIIEGNRELVIDKSTTYKRGKITSCSGMSSTNGSGSSLSTVSRSSDFVPRIPWHDAKTLRLLPPMAVVAASAQFRVALISFRESPGTMLKLCLISSAGFCDGRMP